MNIIILIISLFALSIPVIALFNLSLAVALCVAFEILVPSVFNFSALGIPVPFRVVYFVLLVCFLIKYQKCIIKQLKHIILKPFLVLLILLLILTPFQMSMPWTSQFFLWIRDCLTICILPWIIWNQSLIQKDTFLQKVKIAILVAAAISCIYALFLTRLVGINPYTFIVLGYFSNFSEDYLSVEYSGRLFGRIQSTFEHPMTWSLFLVFIFILLFTFLQKEKKKGLYSIFLILVLLDIFFSGVRTGIVALAIGLGYYVFVERKFKIFVYGIMAFSGVAIAMAMFSSFSNYILSIFDFSGDKSNMQGSSIQMRLDQLIGCLNEIKGVELIGKGYSWTNYYMALKGAHPVILDFESLFFVVICNSGFIGLVIWTSFFIALFRINKRLLTGTNVHIMNTFLISYIVFTILTGDYGYLKIFATYYTFLLCYLLVSNNSYGVKRELKSSRYRILSAPVPRHS